MLWRSMAHKSAGLLRAHARYASLAPFSRADILAAPRRGATADLGRSGARRLQRLRSASWDIGLFGGAREGQRIVQLRGYTYSRPARDDPVMSEGRPSSENAFTERLSVLVDMSLFHQGRGDGGCAVPNRGEAWSQVAGLDDRGLAHDAERDYRLGEVSAGRCITRQSTPAEPANGEDAAPSLARRMSKQFRDLIPSKNNRVGVRGQLRQRRMIGGDFRCRLVAIPSAPDFRTRELFLLSKLAHACMPDARAFKAGPLRSCGLGATTSLRSLVERNEQLPNQNSAFARALQIT